MPPGLTSRWMGVTMLEFGTPLWLLGLPLALLVPWLRRGARVRFSALSAVSYSRSVRVWAALCSPLLASLALAALTVALARPQLVDRERVVEREGIDIQIVLDTSGSMEAEDFVVAGRAASRLDVSKTVIAQFIEGRPDDRVGLVIFGEEAFTQVPLTLDHDALAGMLSQVDIGMAGSRATAIGDAIAVGGKRLKELDAQSRVMILLTDGHNNAGKVDPIVAAKAADTLGVRIYTIGVGSKDGGGRGGLLGLFTRRSSDLDEPTLRAIAEQTDARYFRASDTRALQEVYATIDALEKTTAESRIYVHREERFQPAAIVGLFLLLCSSLLSETWLRRLP
jgi:Ca-activated chloride channel homolog